MDTKMASHLEKKQSLMAETNDPGPAHPKVVRRVVYEGIWPAGEAFPQTPLEAWYVMQGWAVQPAGGINIDQVGAMPGRIEGGTGWVWLSQS